MMIAKLRRMQFGRSSEQLDAMIDQLQLNLEELQVIQTELTPPTESPPRLLASSLGASRCLNICLAKYKRISPSRNVLAAVGICASWVRICLRCWSTSRRVLK